jgi:DNA-binding NarL/FixJ family response regulator
MTIDLALLAPRIALRAGLQALFEAEPRFRVRAEGAGLGELSGARFDVLVVAVPELLNREALASLLDESDEAFAVLVLSDDTQDAGRVQGLPLRAWGLLAPNADEDQLLAAANALHEGLLVGAPNLMRSLLGQMATFAGTDEIVEELTARESEVLELLADGYANKQMALALGISEHTIKFHIASIYNKLNVTNRAEAVRAAARLGLIFL